MRNPQKQTIKLESVKDKSTLVKLLAEEDVTVSYQKVATASFNPNTREVVLPIWKDKSESVMDMMSLHEVGHALYTPVDLIEKGFKKQVKHSFLNVLEDVRIEKMIQDKYLGSVRVFKKAYTELLEKDFFNVNGKDLSKLNLIDRINMHYKNVPNVPFSNDELEWVDKANQTKTSDDVLNLAIELQDWMKENQKDTESDEMFESDIIMPDTNESEDTDDENSESDDSNSSENGDQESDNTDGDGDGNSDSDNKDSDTDNKSDDGKSSKNIESDDKQEQKIKGYAKGAGGEDFDGIEATTDTNYQKKQYDAIDQDATEIEYLNIPKVNVKEVIVDYKKVNKELSEHYNSKTQGRKENERYMDFINKDIVRFKNEQKSTISYMVKEFEMKKAADLYKRSTVSKTGTLNMDKLHSYSYNEDIFLKMNVEPGATNHGLVMFVDWSGSMHDNFYNTIKQTLNLVWFCERVKIPFEVYGFTNGYSNRDDTIKNTKIQKRKQNDIIINELRLLNMLSSRANKDEMNEGIRNIWAYANYFGMSQGQVEEVYGKDDRGYDRYLYPIYPHSDYQLHSTPLNHSIVAAMDVVPQFKKDYGLQKVHTVFLTDGSSNNIGYKYEWSMQDIRPYSERVDKEGKDIPLPDDYEGDYQPTSIRDRCDRITILKDPITNKKWTSKDTGGKYRYDNEFSYGGQTKILLSFLKERVPGMSVTNFFIAGRNRKGTVSRNDIEYIFGLSSWDEYEEIKKIQKFIRKHNYAVCTTSAWDEMYVLPGGEKLNISNDDLSEVQPGAKKTELKRAFGKMSSGKKNSRPVLNKFVGMIA